VPVALAVTHPPFDCIDFPQSLPTVQLRRRRVRPPRLQRPSTAQAPPMAPAAPALAEGEGVGAALVVANKMRGGRVLQRLRQRLHSRSSIYRMGSKV
jgi:hypothetical protein